MVKVKKSLSSMDIAALVAEFQSIVGAYIKKAYQPAREIVVLRLNTTDGRKDLIIRTGKVLYLSSNAPENPPQPTGFAMTLRKYLANGRIGSVVQQEFDRIIRIGIQKEDHYELIIEGFGDGNIVLVKEGRIVQPLISRTWRHRTVRAGRDYEVPPSLVNPRTLTAVQFDELLKGSEKDVVRTLAMGLNLGGNYAEELCMICDIPKDKECSGLTTDERGELYRNMNALFARLGSMQPIIVLERSQYLNVLPFPLKIFESYDAVEKESFNVAVEEYYTHVPDSITGYGERQVEKDEEKVNPDVQRVERTMEQQRNIIEELKHTIEDDRERAERLFLRYQEFEKVLNDVRNYGQEHGWDAMADSLQDHPTVQEVNLADKYVVIRDDPTLIRLDYMRSVNDNARRYYESVSKAKMKLKGARQALEESHKQLERVKKEVIRKKEQKRLERKHFWFEKYRWFISSEGNIVVGGKDAKSNDRVVKKYLKERDRYAHAEIHGAPSIVIKSRNVGDGRNGSGERGRSGIGVSGKKGKEEIKDKDGRKGKEEIKDKDGRKRKEEIKDKDGRKRKEEIKDKNGRKGKEEIKRKDGRKGEGRIEEATLEEACIYAACFSRAWTARIGSLEAYWVYSDQVSKTPAAGEFIAKGAFIVRGKRNRISAPLSLAIGKIVHEGVTLVMCAPLSAVRSRTDSYIVIEPGDIPKNVFAKKISGYFKISNEEALGILPGDIRVIRTKGMEGFEPKDD